MVTKVVHSPALGLMPCEIVGTNESSYLVRVAGMTKPLTVARSQVFDLVEGVTLAEGGRLIGAPVASDTPDAQGTSEMAIELENQPDSDPGDVREIVTSGGSITLEGGKVVSAYCSRCNRGGLPGKCAGGWACICGNVVAQAGELPEEV